jgi:hypothetical protein
MGQSLATLESLKTSQPPLLARTPSHNDLNGTGVGHARNQAIHIRSSSPGHRIVQKTPGFAFMCFKQQFMTVHCTLCKLGTTPASQI